MRRFLTVIYEAGGVILFRSTGIKSNPDTTGCDKISLTYKTPFLIVNSRKDKFLSKPVLWRYAGEKCFNSMEVDP
jgi:hypothetical protein